MRHALFTILAMVVLSAGTRALPAEPQPGPPRPEWEKQVRSLVEQLGHDQFQRREAAQRALLQQGPKIVPVLDKLGPQTDAEIQARLRRIRNKLVGFLDDIGRRLSVFPEIDDSRPPLPEDLKDLILFYQPRSGDYLLSIVADTDDKLHRRATNALLQTWASMETSQIQAYLQLAMTPHAKPRKRYPQGVDASIQMGYHVRYGWGGWPPDKAFEMRTVTTHFLDGKAYGKPFAYQGPAACTGWLHTKDQPMGKHSFHLVTEYEFVRDHRTYAACVESETYQFEMVPAGTPDDLVAADDPKIDQLVRGSLQFSETALDVRRGFIMVGSDGKILPESDPWAPQITWMWGTGRCGLHMPLWKLTRELPVDLCFEVEFHLQQTGEVVEGTPLIVLKGKKVEGYFSPRGSVSDFTKGKSGLIPLKIVLKPSRAMALTDTRVTRYYPGTITSQTLRAKAEHN